MSAAVGTSQAITVPPAPGRRPLIGHAWQLSRSPIAFLESLRQVADLTRIDIGTWPVYMISTPDLVHQVLVDRAHKFGRGRIFERLRPLFGNGLVISDGQFHRTQRRLIQPAFHREKIALYSEIMCKQSEAIAASWRAGRQVQVNDETRHLTLSAVTQTMFSDGPGEAAIAEVHRSLPIILEGMLVRAVVPKALDRLPLPINRRFDQAALRLRRVIDQIIAQHKAATADRQDLLSLLLAGKDPETGERMSDEQIRDEVIAIIMAGTETSATVLAWVFHELGRHPEVERRLHQELDSVIGSRPVRPSDVPYLAYTTAVFTETLRLHSPLLFTRRSLVPVRLGEFHLPAGSEVAYSPYALHRDPRLFPDPTDFDPERWNSDRTRPHDRASFVPFGAGQHKCIGDTFAATEIVIAVAAIASQWRLTPAPGHTVHEKVAGIPQPDQLPMLPTPRRRPSSA
jgi:cytochrome P450